MFNHDQFHDPESGTSYGPPDAVIAERVGRGIAMPAERLGGDALDEMPDEEDPDAVRGPGRPRPRSATRSAHQHSRRSSSTSASALAGEADRDGDGGETSTPTPRSSASGTAESIFTPRRELQPEELGAGG